MKTIELSDCCRAPVEWAKTEGSMFDPPEPYAVCSSCGRKCDVEVVEEEEPEE